MNYGIERGLVMSKTLKKFFDNKFVCEIGCDNGEVLHGLTTHAKKAIGIEINEGPYNEAKELEYHCDTEIVYGDAIEFLKNNPEVTPDVFYFWSNYVKKIGGMQWWMERILELRGTTNPTIIINIDLRKSEGLMQLGSAREIQEIYGGDIILLSFTRNNTNIKDECGLLIIQCDDLTINKNRAAPNWDMDTYYQRVDPFYLEWLTQLTHVDLDSILTDPSDL
tara:strand:+ start:934 stop:1599 length:666 start_codon:yes stop_codon:yes gene_type:complete